MAQVARAGDSIEHPSNPAWNGTIISGSGNVFVNGAQCARNGDPVNCSEHGLQSIVCGSSVSVNGSAIAHLGDSTTCGAVITSASGNVSAA